MNSKLKDIVELINPENTFFFLLKIEDDEAFLIESNCYPSPQNSIQKKILLKIKKNNLHVYPLKLTLAEISELIEKCNENGWKIVIFGSGWQNGLWTIDDYVKSSDKESVLRLIRYHENKPGGMRYLRCDNNCIDFNGIMKGDINYRMLGTGRIFRLESKLFKHFGRKISQDYLEKNQPDILLEISLRKKMQDLLNTSEKISNDEMKKLISSTGKLKIHILDVGQGDTIVLENADNNEVILIDTFLNNQNAYNEFENIIGGKKIRAIIVSHLHYDHIKSVIDISEKFNCPKIIIKDNSSLPTSTAINLLNKVAKKILCVTNHVEFNFAGAILHVLPTLSRNRYDPNNDGLIVLCESAKKLAVLGGDVSGPEIINIMNNYQTQSINNKIQNNQYNQIIYKVSHHCSQTADPQSVYNKFFFNEAITSCGKNNRYKHPHKTTKRLIDKLTSVHSTTSYNM